MLPTFRLEDGWGPMALAQAMHAPGPRSSLTILDAQPLKGRPISKDLRYR